MLRDGKSLGLGALLEPITPAVGSAGSSGGGRVPTGGGNEQLVRLRADGTPVSAVSGGEPDAKELLTRAMIEKVFPKHTPNPQSYLRTDAGSLAASTAKGVAKTREALEQVRLPEVMRRWPEEQRTQPESQGASGRQEYKHQNSSLHQ